MFQRKTYPKGLRHFDRCQHIILGTVDLARDLSTKCQKHRLHIRVILQGFSFFFCFLIGFCLSKGFPEHLCHAHPRHRKLVSIPVGPFRIPPKSNLHRTWRFDRHVKYIVTICFQGKRQTTEYIAASRCQKHGCNAVLICHPEFFCLGVDTVSGVHGQSDRPRHFVSVVDRILTVKIKESDMGMCVNQSRKDVHSGRIHHFRIRRQCCRTNLFCDAFDFSFCDKQISLKWFCSLFHRI